jgi:uncharacterized membrane protein
MASMHIGRRLAPARFITFILVFLIGLFVAIPQLGWSRGLMASFDAGAILFLLMISQLLTRGEAAQMRKNSKANDANRAVLLGITSLVTITILVAVWKEMRSKSDDLAIALVITTLILAWLFSNMIYALHYAHLYYLDCEDGKDPGGVEFPDTKEPDYWDFIYFSFTLGMTFQTSDVNISSSRIRRIVTGQCLAAFVFNLGILAFTINTLGSAGGG